MPQRIQILKLSTVIAFFLASQISFGQVSTSQKKMRSFGKAESASVLLDSAELYFDSDFEVAFNYIESALEASIRRKDRKSEARCYLLLGKSNFKLEQYSIALGYFEKTGGFKESLEEKDLAEVFFQKALTLEKIGKPRDALKSILEAINFANGAQDDLLEINCRYTLARFYVQDQQNDRALNEYQIILELEKERGSQRGIAEANQYIADTYLDQDQTDKAMLNYAQAAQIADEVKDPELKTKVLEKQANAYRRSRLYEEELQVRQQSLQLSDSLNIQGAVADNNLSIGEVYMEKKELDNAVTYIERSVELSEINKDFKRKGKALKKLSDVYGQKGDYARALDYYKEYTQAADSAFGRREKQLEDNLALVANVSRNMQRIDMLEKDYELTKKALSVVEKEKALSSRELVVQKRISYILVLVIVALLISTLLIYRSSLQKRKANMMLALRSLRTQMNPHFIFNSLNSVNSYIATNNERLANKYLSEFSRLMRMVMENSKHDFVSLDSEVEVLKLYLKLEHTRFEDKFDYNFTVDESLNLHQYLVPPMLIQPYIENAVWHGLRYKKEKGWLEVSLKATAQNSLLVTITDDGIGRKQSQTIKTRHQKEKVSTGMKNTNSRLKIIKDVYGIDVQVNINDKDANTGEGTIVELNIPLKVQQEAEVV